MGLLAWFRGRNSTGGAGPQFLVPKVTMLTILERRRMQRAGRSAAVREAIEALFEAERKLRAATDLDSIEAAGLELSLAVAELRMLNEFPGG